MKSVVKRFVFESQKDDGSPMEGTCFWSVHYVEQIIEVYYMFNLLFEIFKNLKLDKNFNEMFLFLLEIELAFQTQGLNWLVCKWCNRFVRSKKPYCETALIYL